MNNLNNTQEENVSLLNEILALPSEQILQDRFVESSENAACTGHCKAGSCMAIS